MNDMVTSQTSTDLINCRSVEKVIVNMKMLIYALFFYCRTYKPPGNLTTLEKKLANSINGKLH